MTAINERYTINERYIVGEDLPPWAGWTPSTRYTIGIEEEIMILDARDWSLAQRNEEILAGLGPDLAGRCAGETHRSVLELATEPHATPETATRELRSLRQSLQAHLVDKRLRGAAAATHPTAVWSEIEVSSGQRYRLLLASMRELARREPTFALHVHVGVDDPERATHLLNQLRAHLPLLLALSANSPFWQGRDTGLSSTRTPIFGAFPRVGIPRAFASYADWVGVVETMLAAGAIPEPTFLWWDVRLQPRFGTVEVRIMDVQSTAWRSGVLAALVQAIARLELEEGYHDDELVAACEVLSENRFLAARDGMEAEFIDPVRRRLVPARQELQRLLGAVVPHAQDLGTDAALDGLSTIAEYGGAVQQRRLAREHGWSGMLRKLAGEFSDA